MRYQAREAIELAFIAALQRLPPRQIAALVLCDVLGFATGEEAAMLGATPTAVKGALQRARETLERDPGIARRASPGADPARERDLARRFAEAFSDDDVDGVVALLSETPGWPCRRQPMSTTAQARFLHASAQWRTGRHLRLVPTRANTQPAFGCYLPDPDGRRARATGILVLTIAGDRIHHISTTGSPPSSDWPTHSRHESA